MPLRTYRHLIYLRKPFCQNNNTASSGKMFASLLETTPTPSSSLLLVLHFFSKRIIFNNKYIKIFYLNLHENSTSFFSTLQYRINTIDNNNNNNHYHKLNNDCCKLVFIECDITRFNDILFFICNYGKYYFTSFFCFSSLFKYIVCFVNFFW